MSRKQFGLALALMGVMSLIGGALGSFLLANRTAQAQPKTVPEVIEAKEFHLVDDAGKVRARLAFKGDDPRLTFLNKDDDKIISLGIVTGAKGDNDIESPILLLGGQGSNENGVGLGLVNDKPLLALIEGKESHNIMVLALGMEKGDDFGNGLGFYHGEKNKRAELAFDPSGKVKINLFNENQKLIWKAP